MRIYNVNESLPAHLLPFHYFKQSYKFGKSSFEISGKPSNKKSGCHKFLIAFLFFGKDRKTIEVQFLTPRGLRWNKST